MSLGGALDAALAGLRVTSAGLELTSHNIANANTPGYTRRIIGQAEQAPGMGAPGVVVGHGAGERTQRIAALDLAAGKMQAHFAALFGQMTDVTFADEAGSAGHQDFHTDSPAMKDSSNAMVF